MLFGRPPWNFDIPENFINKKKEDALKLKHYIFYDYIVKNQLVFPESSNNYQISKWIMDLFKKIFVLDPSKRISFKELLEHKIIDYFKVLMQKKIIG